MPQNNFLLFDENKGNMLADAAYQASAQRLDGVQTGIASSQLNNKFAYQVSLIAYAIAQIMNANGKDATDELAVTTFVSNLSNSLVQKVADLATQAQMTAGTVNDKFVSPALVKYVLQNSGLITAAGIQDGVITLEKLASEVKDKFSPPLLPSATIPIASFNAIQLTRNQVYTFSLPFSTTLSKKPGRVILEFQQEIMSEVPNVTGTKGLGEYACLELFPSSNKLGAFVHAVVRETITGPMVTVDRYIDDITDKTVFNLHGNTANNNTDWSGIGGRAFTMNLTVSSSVAFSFDVRNFSVSTTGVTFGMRTTQQNTPYINFSVWGYVFE